MRLSEKAYDLIKDRIVTLELEPLSVIVEQVLQKDLGLGRTPIREALHRLAAEGLVIVAPWRGMFVADISITDLAKIFEVRMVLEGACARLAAQRISPEQVAQMEEVLRDLDQVPEGDSRALMDIDERYHKLFYRAADNEYMTSALERLHALSMRLWHLALGRLGDVRDAVEQHRQITEALKAGDGARAEALIQQHVAQFQSEIKAVL